LLKVSLEASLLGNVGILELEITGKSSGYFILRKKLVFSHVFGFLGSIEYVLFPLF